MTDYPRFQYEYVTPKAAIETARLVAADEQYQLDDQAGVRVFALIKEQLGQPSTTAVHLTGNQVHRVTELVTSEAFLHALGFTKVWEYGHDHQVWDADSEDEAHLKAARDPEIVGGHVRHRWERPSVWMPHDENRVNRQRELAERRAELVEKHNEENRLLEQKFAAELAALEREG